jgi:hypothetical protein
MGQDDESWPCSLSLSLSLSLCLFETQVSSRFGNEVCVLYELCQVQIANVLCALYVHTHMVYAYIMYMCANVKSTHD